MDSVQNDTLRKVGVAVGVLLALFLLAKTITEFKEVSYVGKDVPAMSVISVSGKGEVIAVPDVATFTFTVSEEDPVVATAQNDATKKMNAILAFLEENGIEDKDVKTTEYSINPQYNYINGTWSTPGRQVLRGYLVSQSVEVRVRELESAGKLLTGIGEFGATNISGLAFKVDNEDDLLKEARAKAIVEAKENAEKLAEDLGVKLVRITSYYDQSPYYPYPYYREMAVSSQAYDGMGGANMIAPELPSGESKIISNVTITYEIK